MARKEQPSWVKEFRKAIKASCPKGWLVVPNRNGNMRVQIYRASTRIADISIPYKWKESEWIDALNRIRNAAKSFEENPKLDIRTCFNIAHKVSSKNPNNWKAAIDAYKKEKKVKDSNWQKKYMPVLVDFEHKIIDGQRVYKYKEERDARGMLISKERIPCTIPNVEKLSKKAKDGKSLCKAALKRWEQGSTIHRHMRLALYGFLRFCVEDQNFESIWLPPAVTKKDAVSETKRKGYPLTDAQIIRLLESFPDSEEGNRWKFGFQCMATYGLRPEDLRHIHTRNGGQEIWSNYEKSKGGLKAHKTEPRRLFPLLVQDVDEPINWNLKEQLYISEQSGKTILPPLGKEGDAGNSCKNYLRRREVWEAIKKEVAREKQELTAYSFRHRYAYYGHNRPKADGTYRSPKQVADALGHSLDVHMISYARFMSRELENAFDETTLLVKAA